MLDLGNFWADHRNPTATSSYHAIINEIHVLLVEHESDGLLNTAKMLEICQYRVTLVEFASAAISMLMSGKAKYDVVIANINSPDLHGFKLLQQAVTLGLPTLVMSNDDNTYMAMRALENGAFLYVKKPLTLETLKCLWQHAVREKTRMVRERERDSLMGAPNGVDAENLNTLESMMVNNKNKGKSKSKKIRDKDCIDEELAYDHQNRRATNNSNVKRKMCTEWTQELHAKFMAAVEELGEGRCFPKEILELMNVSGLTRMQVASHLQKCRNDNWRSPLERKSQLAAQPVTSDPNGSGPKPRRFGSKPLLKTSSDQPHNPCGPEPGSEYQSEYVMPNNGTPSYHHQQLYGMGPGPVFAQLTANHRHSGDEFFSFQDVECLIQNFSGLAYGSGLHHPSPAQCGYNFSPNYYEQNSGGPSMESKSQWSSEFESDQSAETRGQYDQ